MNTLLAMPSAKEFPSRNHSKRPDASRRQPERSAKLSAQIVAELNVKPDDLQTIPYRQLVDVSMAIIAKNRPSGPPDVRRMADQLGFAPVVDENSPGAPLRSHRARDFRRHSHHGRHRPQRIRQRHRSSRIRSDDRRRSRQARHNFLRRASRPCRF